MTEEDINRTVDALISEVMREHRADLKELVYTCPLEETDTIRRRMYGYMFMLAMERNPNRTVEVSIALLTSFLCEIYRWRERYGVLNPIIN